ESRRAPGAAPSVPDAPTVGTTSARVDLPHPGAIPKPQPKAFVPPRETRHADGSVSPVPDAPAVGTTSASARVDLPQPGALPRPPPRPARSAHPAPNAWRTEAKASPWKRLKSSYPTS